jgi:autotransporter-associated beta strand protein
MQRHRFGLFRKVLVCFLLVCLTGTGGLQAAPRIWSGGGADAQWTTGGNWVGGVAVSPGDSVVYDANAVARLTNQTLGASISIGGITLTTPAGAVTVLPGGTLTLGTDAGIDLSAANQDLSLGCGVTLGAAQAWTVNTGRTLTVSGAIDGPFSLAKAGAGTLVLQGTNTFSGGLIVSNGTVRPDRDAALGAVTGTVTLAGGTLALNQAYASRPLALQSDSAVSVARNFASFWGGPLTGSGTLTLKGGYASSTSSQLSFINNANNTFSGSLVVDVDGGTLKIGGNPYFSAGTAAQGLALPNMTSANSITVRRGATFYIEDNVNAAIGYAADRFGTSGNRPKVNLAGGTFSLNGANTAATLSQSFDTLSLVSGGSVVNVSRNMITNPTRLVFSNLVVSSGAFANFTGTALGAGSTNGQVVFNTAPAVIGGGGAAGTKTMSIVPQVRCGNDLVCYDVNGIRPLAAVTEYNEVAGANDINAAGTTENVKLTGATTPFTALSAGKTINALVNSANVDATWPLGQTLTLTSGQLIGGIVNKSLNISSGVLTAGSGTTTNLDITVMQNTTTVGANINNNGAGAITLVKNGAGGLTLANATDNTYSGGTFVNEGSLNTGASANLRYLGSGPVRVDNAQLTLGAIGATANSTGDDYTVFNGGQVSIASAAYTTNDTFNIGAGSVIAGLAAAGTGLNSLDRGVGMGISNITLAADAIVAGPAVAAPLDLSLGFVKNLGTNADLYYGLNAAQNTAAGAVTIGSGTAFKGIGVARGGQSWNLGTVNVTAGTRDIYLQGLSIPGAAPYTLTIGNALAAGGPVFALAGAGTLNANILGSVTLDDDSAVFGDTSAGKIVNLVVQPGSTLTVNQPVGLGSGTGIPTVDVRAGGTLAINNPAAVNRAVSLPFGARFIANQVGGLAGAGALTFQAGSILEIASQASAFNGPQAAAASINPGTIVRLNNLANFGTTFDPLDGYLGSKSPIYEIYGGGSWFANPVATNTVVLTLNRDSVTGMGGLLVNDGVSRTLPAVANGKIVVGPNGGTIAATTNTALTVAQGIELGANALTIGSVELIDGQPPKQGAVILSAVLGYSTALPGSSITVIPGASLTNTADAIPDAADLIVNGSFTVAAQETIGSLSGSGVAAVNASLTVGRNNNSTNFSGLLAGANTLYKSGTGRLDITGSNNTYAGAATVNAGTLALSGNGTLTNTGTTAFSLVGDGTLLLDNTSVNLSDRLSGALPGITFQGGTFRFAGMASAASSESLGAATFSGGASTIDVVNGAGGSCDVTFSVATAGAGTVNFTASNGTLGTAGNNPRVKFTGLGAGLVGYATVNGSYPAYNDATYGIRAYTLGEATEFDGTSSAQTALDTKYTTANNHLPLSAAKTVNSLWIDSPGAGCSVDLGASGVSNLTITTGRVNLTGTDSFEIKRSGTSTATLLRNSAAMYFNVDDAAAALTISVPIANGSGTVTKEGPGTLVLNGSNTFTGALTLNEGITRYGANGLLADAAPVTIWGSGILDYNGITDTIGAVTIYSGGITNAGAGGVLTAASLTLGAGPAGSSAWISTGTGSLKLGGNVAYNVANDPNTATIAGTLDLNGVTRTFTVNNSVAPGAAIDLDVPALVTGGAGYGITKANAGTLRLGGSNTFDGVLTMNNSGGIVILGNPQALGTPSMGRTESIGTTCTLALDGVGIYDPNNRLTLSLNGSGSTLVGPVSGELVNLAGNNAVPCAVTLAANTQIASLKAGDKLTLGGNVSGATFTLTVDGAGDTELDGVLGTTSGGLTKNGSGTLTLGGSSANTFTGATTVNDGKLLLNKSGAAAAIPIGTVTVNSGGLLQYAAGTANTDLVGTILITLSGTGQLDFNGATDTVGPITIASATGAATNTTPIVNSAGGGNLSIGTLTITPALGYLTRINTGSGTLTLTNNLVFNPSGAGRAQISGYLGLGAATRTFAVAGGGTGADNDLEIDAVISGGAGVGLTQTSGGLGKLKLSGANTYAGDTTVTSGILKLGNNAAIPAGPGKGNVSVSGTLDLNGFSQTINGLAAGGTIDNTAAGAVTLTLGSNDQTAASSGIIKNTGGALSLVKVGNGTQTLSGVSTFVGPVLVSAGALNAANQWALGTVAGGVTVASGAALQLQGGTAVGAEPLTLNGAGSSADGALRNISGVNSFAGPITLGSDARINSDNNVLTLSGGVTGSGYNLTVGGASNVTFTTAAIATGSGGLTKDGAGILTLSYANNFTGLTEIKAGALVCTVNDALWTGDVKVSGGTYNIGNFADSIGNLLLASGSVLGFGTLTGTNYAVQSGTIVPNLAGAGVSLTKDTAGAVTLSGTNTFTGPVTINAGTLVAGNGQAFGPAATAVVNFTPGSNARLQANGTNVVLAGLTGDSTATIENGSASLAGSLTLNATGAVSLAVRLQNGAGAAPLSFRKGGIGTLTLVNSNAYSGGTIVYGGTLVMANDGALGTNTMSTVSTSALLRVSSGITLRNGLTLVPGGSIAGAGTFALSNTLVVANAGRVQPGDNAIGTLTVTNSLILGFGSMLDVEFKQPDAGDGNDLLVVGGTLTITSAAVNVYAEGTTTNAALTNGTYNLIQYGVLNGSVSNLYVGNPDLAKRYTFDTAGGYVRLNVSDASNVTTSDSTAKDWNTNAIWSVIAFPSAGNYYELLGGASVAAAAGSTFPGASLQIDTNATLTPAGNATLAKSLVLNGGKVSVTAASITPTLLASNGVVLAGGSTGEINVALNTSTLTVPNSLAGGGALIKTGSGKLSLTGANAHTGGTIAGGGALAVTDGRNLGGTPDLVTVPVTVASNGVLDCTAGGGALTLTSFNVATSSVGTVMPPTGGLTVNNPVTLANSDLTLTHTVGYFAPVLNFAGGVTVRGNGRLTRIYGPANSAKPILYGQFFLDNSDLCLTSGGSGNHDFRGVISGTGNLLLYGQTGGHSLLLRNNHTFTGSLTILGTAAGASAVVLYGTNLNLTAISVDSYGTLQNGVSDPLSSVFALPFVGTQSGYNLGGFNQTFAGLISAGGLGTVQGIGILTLNVPTGATYEYSGVLQMTGGALVKKGGGTQIFSGLSPLSQNYTSWAPIIVSNGTLVVRGSALFSSFTNTAGALLVLDDTCTGIGGLGGSGSVQLGMSRGASLIVGGGNGSSASLNALSGTLNGLVKIGSGTFRLGGPSVSAVPTVVLGGMLQMTTNLLGPISVCGGALQLTNSAVLGSTQQVTVGNAPVAPGILSLTYDGFPTANLAANSAGVIAIDTANYTTPLNFATIGAGRMFLGSTLAGTNAATSLLPCVDNVYRLGGGGGTLYLDAPGMNGVLTGACDVTVGMNGISSTLPQTIQNTLAGTVSLLDANTFSGALTVNNFSTLVGAPQALGNGSPLGDTAGAVVLNGGTLQIGTGAVVTARQPVSKGALTVGGDSKIVMSGSTNRLNFTSIVRTGAVLTVQGGSPITNVLSIASGVPAPTNGMVAPWLVCLTGNTTLDFCTNDAVNGLQPIGPLAYTAHATSFAPASTEIAKATAALTINPGTLYAMSFAPAAAVNVGIGPGTVSNTSGGILVGGSGATTWTGGNSGTVDVGNAEAIIDCTQDLNLQVCLAGASGLVKAGSARINLNNCVTNTIAGTFTIANGAVGPSGVNGSQNIWNMGWVFTNITNYVLNGGAWFQGGGQSCTITFPSNQTITVGPNGGGLKGAGSLTLNGQISGSGPLNIWATTYGLSVYINHTNNTLSGPVFMLGDVAASTYTYAAYVASNSSLGTGSVAVDRMAALTLYGPSNIDRYAQLSLGAGGVVNLYSSLAPFTIGSLLGVGTLTLSNATLSVGWDGRSADFAGIIADKMAGSQVGSLTMNGPGTQSLWGANTYSGPTAVTNGGTLLVNGSIGNGAVTVAGGTLGGVGVVNGPVTVSGGGSLAAGSYAGGFGLLTISNNLTLAADGTSRFDLGAPGTGDRVVVSGNLAFGGTVAVTPRAGFRSGIYTLFTYGGSCSTTNSVALVGCAGRLYVDTQAKAVMLDTRSYGSMILFF